MTALQQYARLETLGLWQPAPGAAAQEVVVALGEATLTLADGNGRPLAHWSLAAVRQVGEAGTARRYAPQDDGDESLTIDDPDMIAALSRVRQAVDRAERHPGRLRRAGIWAGLALGAAAAALWLPGALLRQTAATLPDLTRSEIGAALLGHMQGLTGPSCRDEVGAGVLDRLTARLTPETPWQIVVLPGSLNAPQALPGRILAVPATLLAQPDGAEHLAAALIAADAGPDPLPPLLRQAGWPAAFSLMTSGSLPDSAIALHAASLIAAPAGPPGQWQGEPPMPDADWVALQAICAE